MCRLGQMFFLILYALAAAIWLVGTFGWFGVTRDPLSGVYLIMLGMPWALLVDAFSEPFWPAASALAPALNLAAIALVCRLVRRTAA